MTAEIQDGHTLTRVLADGKEFSFRRPVGGDIARLFGKLGANIAPNDAGEITAAFDIGSDIDATCAFIAKNLRTWWLDHDITPAAVYDIDYTEQRQITAALIDAHFELPDGAAEKNS